MEGTPTDNMTLIRSLLEPWTEKLKGIVSLASTPSSSHRTPYENVQKGIEEMAVLNFEVDTASNTEAVLSNPNFRFWVRFVKIQILALLAKWYDTCEELSVAQDRHEDCLQLLDKELATGLPETEDDPATVSYLKHFYVYQLARYAILCSQRDNQDKSLQLLKKAEMYYHDNELSNVKAAAVVPDEKSLLALFDYKNVEKDMFTFLLFYLGQSFKIHDQREKAIPYLHMVLRRQLEGGEYDCVQWGSDCCKMASVLMVNSQVLEVAKDMLMAATSVMKETVDKTSECFVEAWSDLARTWSKLGLTLMEFSQERLKDIQDQEIRRELKFDPMVKLDKYEKLSLGICKDSTESNTLSEHDTVVMIRSLKFPSLDYSNLVEHEKAASSVFARDFPEARAMFLSAQHWTNIAKEYYKLDDHASDYVELTTDYAALFKSLAFFETSLERRIKMHKRRVTIVEELLSSLNPKIYTDVFHLALRDLSEAMETIYKLKVDELKDRGKSLRPKDEKLVKYLVDAVAAHRRNLELFGFDVSKPENAFPKEYEKILMACVLSCGRILGSICHDHPLHHDAADLGEEAISYYQFFLSYLDRKPDLKREFFVLYEGCEDMPELLESQIRKIKRHHRIQEMLEDGSGSS